MNDLLEISLGDLGLTLEQFYTMTPGELFLRIGAFNRTQERDWHKLRVFAAIYLNSIKGRKGKTIQPQDVIKLPIDRALRSERKKNISADEFKKLTELWQKKT